MDHRGILLAIEPNGYTQSDKVIDLLHARLQNVGYQTRLLKFPQNNEPASYYSSQYKAGKYGPLEKSNTYIAALLYAMEHFDATESIQQALTIGEIVICQGYAGANLHRFAPNIAEAAQRRGFYIWLDDLEHQLMKIPRPDKTFLLSVSSSSKAIDDYDEICRLFPKDFSQIDCKRDDQELSPEMVEDILWKTISASLITEGGKQPEKPAPKIAPRIEEPAQTTAPVGLSGSINKMLTDSASTFYMPKFIEDTNKVTYSQGLLKLNKLQQALGGSLATHFAKHSNSKTALKKAMTATWLVHPIAEITTTDIFADGKLETKVSQKILNALPNGSHSYGSDTAMATLQKHSPSNELELISYLLYSNASMSSDDIKLSIDKLSIEKKNKLMTEALAEIKKGSPDNLNKLDFSYTWEFLTSYGAYHYLSSAIQHSSAVHQPLSPRYGYDTPEIIDQAELNDEYEECYQESLRVFSKLQEQGLEREAQYLTLLGHRTHWTMSLNLGSLIQLLELLEGSSESELQLLHSKILEEILPVQPVITEHLLN